MAPHSPAVTETERESEREVNNAA